MQQIALHWCISGHRPSLGHFSWLAVLMVQQRTTAYAQKANECADLGGGGGGGEGGRVGWRVLRGEAGGDGTAPPTQHRCSAGEGIRGLVSKRNSPAYCNAGSLTRGAIFRPCLTSGCVKEGSSQPTKGRTAALPCELGSTRCQDATLPVALH